MEAIAVAANPGEIFQPIVEMVSIVREAYLDLAGTERLHGRLLSAVAQTSL